MADIVILNDELENAKEAGSTEEIVKRMRVIITRLKGKYMSEDGSCVNYKEMGTSEEFKEYVTTVQQLNAVQLNKLSQDELKCLFLNLYNSLTVHAMIHQSTLGGLPAAPKDVAGFWRIHCYKVGGFVYSLDDMEHGVLRANKGHPAAGAPQFPSSDARSQNVVKILDPRIHFALNCGAQSCPPIRVYTVDRLEQQLDTASVSFLSQEVVVVGGRVEATKLLLWYEKDFGSTTTEVLAWIDKVTNGRIPGLTDAILQCPEILHKDYNWDANTTK